MTVRLLRVTSAYEALSIKSRLRKESRGLFLHECCRWKCMGNILVARRHNSAMRCCGA